MELPFEGLSDQHPSLRLFSNLTSEYNIRDCAPINTFHYLIYANEVFP